MDVPCIICNKIVYRKPAELKVRINTFCSQKCYAVEKSRRWKQQKNPRFTNGNLTKICEVCHITFTSKSYGAERNAKIVACSKKCGNKVAGKRRCGENHWAWNGGLGRITKPIRAKRKYKDWINTILIRDNHTCQKCHSKEKVEVHHIIELAKLVNEYKAKHGKLDSYDDFFYKEDNGIALCRSCHMTNHKKVK